MKNLAVIFGGKSVEHDISIITAMQVMKYLKGWNVIPIYMNIDGEFLTSKNFVKAETFLNNKFKSQKILFDSGKPYIYIFNGMFIKQKIEIDCALLCNHGHGGEDGSLQGMLEVSNIPYTSCGVFSSSLCMDKCLSKTFFKSFNIPHVFGQGYLKNDYEDDKNIVIEKIKKDFDFPCIVKPSSLGSSVGINICTNEQMLGEALDEGFTFDNKILVEKFLTNVREFSCAVFSIKGIPYTSKVCEVLKKDLYSFDDKYITQKANSKFDIETKLEKNIQSLAIKTYKKMQCYGIVRIDFLYDNVGKKLYVNELNTIPGSLSCNMFDTPFQDILNMVIQDSIELHNRKNDVIYKFNSEAISTFISLDNQSKFKI